MSTVRALGVLLSRHSSVLSRNQGLTSPQRGGSTSLPVAVLVVDSSANPTSITMQVGLLVGRVPLS